MDSTIKKILVPVDFTETSDEALRKAVEIANRFDAELFILHVLEFPGYAFSILPELQIDPPAEKEVEEIILRKLNSVRDQIYTDHKISPTLSISRGNIDREIGIYAEDQGIDLIVMGTHGASGYQEYFVGSNAQRLVTVSEVPVMTLQSDFKKNTFDNILVPLDNSLHSREKFNIAIEFAKIFGSQIHLLGLPDSEEKKDLAKFQIKIESVEAVLNASGIKYQTHIVKGDHVAKEALGFAEKHDIDLIVINTGHESEISGIFLGAFAQQIVNHAKIPVVSIKHIHGVYEITTPGFGIQ